jgi:hypothetical protein
MTGALVCASAALLLAEPASAGEAAHADLWWIRAAKRLGAAGKALGVPVGLVNGL